MQVTSGAATEPARPVDDDQFWYWHPRSLEIHLWVDDSGVPRISMLDERAPAGGLELPAGAFLWP